MSKYHLKKYSTTVKPDTKIMIVITVTYFKSQLMCNVNLIVNVPIIISAYPQTTINIFVMLELKLLTRC